MRETEEQHATNHIQLLRIWPLPQTALLLLFLCVFSIESVISFWKTVEWGGIHHTIENLFMHQICRTKYEHYFNFICGNLFSCGMHCAHKECLIECATICMLVHSHAVSSNIWIACLCNVFFCVSMVLFFLCKDLCVHCENLININNKKNYYL